MEARRPSRISEHAVTCLQEIAAAGLGRVISLGRALGLLHYIDHRNTKDVDAWWSDSVTTEEKEKVLASVEKTLASSGQVSRRSWGDVVSIELQSGSGPSFSFQIARRSARLQPPSPAPWVDVLLDALPDLLASKMVALVERGAPRDFRDVHAACQAGIASAAECWSLWRERQSLAGSDSGTGRARLAIETHLERIAQHRPLEKIQEDDKRTEASEVRRWFREDFFNAILQ